MKKESWALWVISIAALGFSIYAALSCDKRIEADWMGILVGVLALLVTALIGWQILAISDIRNIRKSIKNTESAVYIKTENGFVEFHASMVACYREQLKDSESNELIVKFLMSYLYLIIHEGNINETARCEREINNLINDIESLKPIHIKQEQWEVLYKLLRQISANPLIQNAHLLFAAFHSINYE